MAVISGSAAITKRPANTSKRAAELQPDYALAWTGVADFYAAGAVVGQMSPRDSLWRAEAAARRAVSLDDSLAQAHHSLCAVSFFADWNWPQALQQCARALELDPKLAETYHLRAKILATLNGGYQVVVQSWVSDWKGNPATSTLRRSPWRT